MLAFCMISPHLHSIILQFIQFVLKVNNLIYEKYKFSNRLTVGNAPQNVNKWINILPMIVFILFCF
jgi:hypothetical protein